MRISTKKHSCAHCAGQHLKLGERQTESERFLKHSLMRAPAVDPNLRQISATRCLTKPSNYQQRPEVHIVSRIKFLGNGAKMPEDGDHFSLEAIKPNDPTTARYDDSDSASHSQTPFMQIFPAQRQIPWAVSGVKPATNEIYSHLKRPSELGIIGSLELGRAEVGRTNSQLYRRMNAYRSMDHARYAAKGVGQHVELESVNVNINQARPATHCLILSARFIKDHLSDQCGEGLAGCRWSRDLDGDGLRTLTEMVSGR
ncbi:hypothetical protein RRG08_044667 [Elysia crispata]|uniref:Uncharacterized protein n=1 Tax=Elysia crispata TaxID=231223 RepID=A0AAE1DA76_9GAST|nr:hypothetical protein RRG08_044667 [Elysia crispata]